MYRMTAAVWTAALIALRCEGACEKEIEAMCV